MRGSRSGRRGVETWPVAVVSGSGLGVGIVCAIALFMARAVMEGWMVRYGRRKIGRSFFHKRYFVLEPVMLAYYKKKPSDKEVPLKSLLIDGNCRVQDRGLETHHGHAVYVLSIYNMKDKSHRITMAALNIQEACAWKEALERAIDQVTESQIGQKSATVSRFDIADFKNGNEPERTASSSDRESLPAQEEDEKQGDLCGNGLPDSVRDWSCAVDPLFSEREKDPLISRKHMRLVRCQNGLRFFEQIADGSRGNQSPYKAMMAVGVVDASCSDIFELIMGMGETRYEWDCSFHVGSTVEEVDGHTGVVYHRLQLEYFPMLVWPRDLCYTRYWRRNDDGSYVILFRSREHPLCPPQPGCVRAHMESGGFTISPLQNRANSGEPRARVQHLVEIDLKGWGVGRVPFIQQHTMIQMLNSVAGLREWFAQRDGGQVPTPTPRMGKMSAGLVTKKQRKRHIETTPSMEQMQAASLQEVLADEDSDDEADDFVVEDKELMSRKLFKEQSSPDGAVRSVSEEELAQTFDLTAFCGSLKKGDLETGKNCWSIPHGNNFRVRSKRFLTDRTKVPAGEPLMQLVAVDWFKDSKRMDHLARRKGCAAQVAAEKGFFTIAFNIQVPGSMHYSMVFYFVSKKPFVQGSLLQRFVDGDDGFRNSRLKLIPSVPKGSWIVRQSVGSTPCILGKAVDCTYIRGQKYLEVDADIGSSTVANGVLSLVFGVVTSLVVDMAFLIQGNGMDELPERLIGAVRVSHLELGAAIFPDQNLDSAATVGNV